MAADERLLKIGLLFAADMDVSLEEQTEYYSFHHKLIQEHLAARFLTQKVKHDRESFRTFFPEWDKDIMYGRHKEVVGFMVGMDASIMEQVCTAYADYITHSPHLLDDDLLFLNNLQNEAASTSTPPITNTMPIVTYDYSWHTKHTDISSIPISQALLSSYIVIVKNVEDLGLLPPLQKIERRNTKIYHTRALLMENCSYEVVQHVVESIQGIPITHLSILYTIYEPRRCSAENLTSSYSGGESDPATTASNESAYYIPQISVMGSDSDIPKRNSSLVQMHFRQMWKGVFLKTNPRSPLYPLRYIQRMQLFKQGVTFLRECMNAIENGENASFNGNQADNSLMFCKQARGIFLGASTLPMSLLEQLGQQLHSCQQLQTLCLEDVKTVLPDGSVTRLPPNQCEILCSGLIYLSKLQVINLNHNPLGEHGQYITQAINAWQPEPQLRTLYLWDCKLPSTTTGELLQALATRCHQLEELNLSGNDLGGQVAALKLHAHSDLKWLQLPLEKCNLQPADGHALAAVIQQRRLPRLGVLELQGNPSLGEEAAAAILNAALAHHQGPPSTALTHKQRSVQASFIHSERSLSQSFIQRQRSLSPDVPYYQRSFSEAVTHIKRKLEILLYDCNMSERFVEEWKQKCNGTHVKPIFAESSSYSPAEVTFTA